MKEFFIVLLIYVGGVFGIGFLISEGYGGWAYGIIWAIIGYLIWRGDLYIGSGRE